VMSGEWGWLDRCGGPERGPKLNPDYYPTLSALIDRWKLVEGYMRDFLSSLSEDDLSRIIEFSFTPPAKHSIPLGNLLQHGALHAVHHRGQVALLLRMLGHSPGNFDLVIFDIGDERRAEG
jgi:uncharacterized damage-inducible protein DinB